MGLIGHYMEPGHNYPVGWADLPVVLAAILVLIRPRNPYFLLSASAANIVVFLMSSPTGSNHWTMQFFINVMLWASYFMLAFTRRSWRINPDDWLDIFRPAVCIYVLLLYLFASLHKLNSGFLFSEHSAALRIYHNIAYGWYSEYMGVVAHLIPTDEAFLAIVPHLSIFIELAIPALLFFKPTRLVAIFVGMSFHGLLSIRGYAPQIDFPIVLGATYLLFMPNGGIDIINASVLRRLREYRFYEPFKSIIVPAILLAVIFVPLLYSLPAQPYNYWFTFANLKLYFWATYAAVYIAMAGFLILRLGRAQFDHSLQLFRSLRLPLIPILVSVCFLGMSPYLGLRTSGAFTMYSNLETMGGKSNHLFMPTELQIFDYQKQVCVIETTAEDIPASALTGELLTYYQFRQLTRKNPEEAITYTFKGERYELARIADKPELVAEATWFERFYLVFLKPHPDATTGYCDGR